MSKVTASSIVNDLLDAGILCETEAVGGGTGRKPRAVDVSPDLGVVAAADIDAELATVRLSDLRGRTKVTGSVDVPPDGTANGALLLADLLAAEVSGLRAEAAPGAPLLQLTVAVSASVADDQALTFPGHPRYLRGRDFARELTRRLSNANVALINDTSAAAVGESRHGAASSWEHFAFLGVRRSGIGMGLMLDGTIYRGSHGWAGEVGVLRAVSETAPAEVPRTIEDLDALSELARVIATSFVLLDLEALVVQLERKEAFDWLTELRRHTAALVPFPIAIVESELGGDAPMIGAVELALEGAWRNIETSVSTARARQI